MALSSGGDTALIGAWHNEVGGVIDAGSAYLFARAMDGSWTFQGEISADSPSPDGYFGHSVSLSATGNTAIVGAWKQDTLTGMSTGAASVFTRDEAGLWTFREQLLAPDGSESDWFGYSVALSSAGGMAIVGAMRDGTTGGDSAGSAWAFDLLEEAAPPFQQKLVGPGSIAYDERFGRALATSSAGDTALIEAPNAAYIFDRDDNGIWILHGELPIPSAAVASVALSSSGKTAIVGATNSAYNFTRGTDGLWSLGEQLEHPTGGCRHLIR